MQIVRDSKLMMELAESWLEPELRELLSIHIKRLKECEGYDLSELVNFIVFEEFDAVPELDAALGFAVMVSRFDGVRYGDPEFNPSWEVIEEHVNWFELVYVLSDDGFGVVVFVSKNSDPELTRMLRFYADR